MAGIQLISFNLCPYVQRSVITLEEKGVDYEITYIDLGNKPDWFLKISPFGKVPLLRNGEDVIFESAVINEFLDEAYGEPLMPASALGRAKARMWTTYISSLGGGVYTLMTTTDAEKARSSAAELHEKLARLESEIQGPLFDGADFSLVDSGAAPFLQRIHWLETIQPDLAITAGLPKTQAWIAALLDRPSVKNSTVPDIYDLFKAYLKGGGTPTREATPAWISQFI